MAKSDGHKAMTSADAATDLVSIGDLAEATGIAPDTIRAWERRYGRPEAVRLPSGHRRYTEDDVRWLRRIAEAMARGHRPSQLVHLPEKDLDDLLVPEPGSEHEAKQIHAWLARLRRYETARLRTELDDAARAQGPGVFLRETVAPLVTAVGRSWADGEVSVRHEHLLTEIVEDVLRTLRDGLPGPAGGPLLLLATLEGESHGLGLQMAALACADAGVRTHVLGPDVPVDEILGAARETGADAVAISVSLSTGGIQTDRLLGALRRQLPEAVRLLVGGAGARGVRRGPRGIEYVATWDDFDAWLAAFASADADAKRA